MVNPPGQQPNWVTIWLRGKVVLARVVCSDCGDPFRAGHMCMRIKPGPQ